MLFPGGFPTAGDMAGFTGGYICKTAGDISLFAGGYVSKTAGKFKLFPAVVWIYPRDKLGFPDVYIEITAGIVYNIYLQYLFILNITCRTQTFRYTFCPQTYHCTIKIYFHIKQLYWYIYSTHIIYIVTIFDHKALNIKLQSVTYSHLYVYRTSNKWTVRVWSKNIIVEETRNPSANPVNGLIFKVLLLVHRILFFLRI